MMDIAENGIRAGAATITLTVREEGSPAALKIKVNDDGKGMEEEELKRIEDPFYTSRTTRKVGMGIPLLRQQAELAGGDLKIKSKPGSGTEVEATFLKDHPDRQPLGDLEGCWILLASANPGIEWALHLESGEGDFSISTSEIKSAMELKKIAGNELLGQLRRMIRNNVEELGLV